MPEMFLILVSVFRQKKPSSAWLLKTWKILGGRAASWFAPQILITGIFPLQVFMIRLVRLVVSSAAAPQLYLNMGAASSSIGV